MAAPTLEAARLACATQPRSPERNDDAKDLAAQRAFGMTMLDAHLNALFDPSMAAWQPDANGEPYYDLGQRPADLWHQDRLYTITAVIAVLDATFARLGLPFVARRGVRTVLVRFKPTTVATSAPPPPPAEIVWPAVPMRW